MKIKQKVLKEYKWKYNEDEKSESVANSILRSIGTNEIQKRHNEDLIKAIDLTLKHTRAEIDRILIEKPMLKRDYIKRLENLKERLK